MVIFMFDIMAFALELSLTMIFLIPFFVLAVFFVYIFFLLSGKENAFTKAVKTF